MTTIIPCAKKEMQAEIQQRTIEEMHTQIPQLTQAMQGMIFQRNDALAEEHDEEQSDHDDDANPFDVLRGNQNVAQPVQLNE
ncbi:hypothetical protein YC2023_033758 [Brassica napus]|uniref:Uncharacterized protein n=1 Tax=Brassica campestris TaxID=3711 RepID=M4FI68_BRACM